MGPFVFSAGSSKGTKQSQTYSRRSLFAAENGLDEIAAKRPRLSGPSLMTKPSVDIKTAIGKDDEDKTVAVHGDKAQVEHAFDGRPLQKTRKPLFSSWKRSKSRPFQESKSDQLNKPRSQANKFGAARLTQMSIDVGGASVAVTCSICGMNYVRTAAEDRALHKQICADNASGMRLPRNSKTTMKRVWESTSNKDFIAVVSKGSPMSEREMATKALNLANAELGSMITDTKDLWGEENRVECFGRPDCRWIGRPSERNRHIRDKHPSMFDNSKVLSSKRRACPIPSCVFGDDEKPMIPEDQLEAHLNCHSVARLESRVYLYISDNNIVATLLALPISSARQVDTFLPLAVSDQSVKVLLGVDKIWTARKRRRSRIATQLLTVLQSTWEHGLVIDKKDIAWSWTTELGKHLVRSWWGAETGWLMFVE